MAAIISIGICSVLSLLALIYSIGKVRDYYRLKQFGIACTAVIARMEKRSPANRNADYPVIQFNAEDGQRWSTAATVA